MPGVRQGPPRRTCPHLTLTPLWVKMAVEPMAYHRVRVSGSQVYNDRDYNRWRTDLGWMIRAAAGQQKFAEPVEVSIRVGRRSIAIGVDRGGSRPKGLRGDIDNYAKAVLDALVESTVLTDDRLVTSLTVAFDED